MHLGLAFGAAVRARVEKGYTNPPLIAVRAPSGCTCGCWRAAAGPRTTPTCLCDLASATSWCAACDRPATCDRALLATSPVS